MFGDIAHGFLLFLCGAGMCVFETQIKKTAFADILSIRYLILLMGFFATFCGVLYNDFASMPIEIFGGSCYDVDTAARQPDCVYPLGIDYIWYFAKNEIGYVNSLKMKISVILGVTQMCIGICMKAVNAIEFKSKVDFFFEFIPQIVMMTSLFGYMNFLIIVKWTTDYTGNEHNAPSIINTMINIPLKSGTIIGTPFLGDASTNKMISLGLLGLSLVCVPLMLFFKPILTNHAHNHNDAGSAVEPLGEEKGKSGGKDLASNLKDAMKQNSIARGINDSAA